MTAAVVSPTLCNIQLQFQIIMNSAFCIFRMTTVFFGLLSVGKASCDRVALPDVRCLPGNVRTNVNVCDCTRGGVRTHVRESALKVDSGRKIPCRTRKSNLRQRRAGPTLYQLSYIPTPQMSHTLL